MKYLLFLLLSSVAFAQELAVNPETGVYEYVMGCQDLSSIGSELRKLNYKSIEEHPGFVTATGAFSHLVSGSFPVEIHYNVRYEVKSSECYVVIDRFILQDKNAVPVPLEDLRGHTKKWVKHINKKLPDIVRALKSIESK